MQLSESGAKDGKREFQHSSSGRRIVNIAGIGDETLADMSEGERRPWDIAALALWE